MVALVEPIRIPLSEHQQKRLAAFQQDALTLQTRLNDTITAIVAHDVDPASVQGWDIRQIGSDIVCTPPAPNGPTLVPDIGPDGVSASAAAG